MRNWVTCPGRRPPPASFILEGGGCPKHLLRCNCLTEYIVMAINGFKSKQLSAARAHKLLKVRRTRVFPLCKGNTTLSLQFGKVCWIRVGVKEEWPVEESPGFAELLGKPTAGLLSFSVALTAGGRGPCHFFFFL